MANTDFFSELARGEYRAADVVYNDGDRPAVRTNDLGELIVQVKGDSKQWVLREEGTGNYFMVRVAADGTLEYVDMSTGTVSATAPAGGLVELGQDEKYLELGVVCGQVATVDTEGKAFEVRDKDENTLGVIYLDAAGAAITYDATPSFGACVIAATQDIPNNIDTTAASSTTVGAKSVTIVNLGAASGTVTANGNTVDLEGGQSQTWSARSAAGLAAIAFDPTASTGTTFRVIEVL